MYNVKYKEENVKKKLAYIAGSLKEVCDSVTPHSSYKHIHMHITLHHITLDYIILHYKHIYIAGSLKEVFDTPFILQTHLHTHYITLDYIILHYIHIYIAGSLKEVCDTPFILQTPVCGKSILLYIRKIFCLYIIPAHAQWLIYSKFVNIEHNVVFSTCQCIYQSHLCSVWQFDARNYQQSHEYLHNISPRRTINTRTRAGGNLLVPSRIPVLTSGPYISFCALELSFLYTYTCLSFPCALLDLFFTPF